MRADEKLNFYEGFSLLCMTFLYHVFNEVLPVLVATTGTSAWISQCISAGCSFLLLWLYLIMMRMHRNKDFLEISDAVYGKFFSKILIAILCVFMMFYTAVSLNQSVELLQIYAYSEITSLEIDIIMMSVCCVFALYSFKGLGKTVSIFLPFLLLTLLAILFLSWDQYDPNLLNPIWGYGVFTTVTSGFMLASEFTGLLVVSIFWKAFPDRRAFRKSSLWGIIVASGIFIFTTLCYNMAIPYSCVEDLQVGILGIAQSNRSSRFVQRLESVFIGINVVAIVLLLGIGFLALKKTYCHLFSLSKRHAKAVIIPLALTVICIARTIGNHLWFKTFIRIVIRRYSVILTLGVVLLTILITWIRNKGWKKPKSATVSILLVACMMAGLFSGCGSHYREPDADIYPIILGYDKGTKEKYRITLKFMLDSLAGSDIQAQEESPNGDEIPEDMVVVEAPSFTEGINLINATVPKKISLLHVKMLVVSEEIAREGVAGFVGPLIRYNETKPTMAFVVCRDSAYDLIAAERSNLTDSLQMDMELILDGKKGSTSYFITTIEDVLFYTKSNYGDALATYGAVSQSHYDELREDDETLEQYIDKAPESDSGGYLPGELPTASNNQMEIAGCAVFKEDRMVGTLTTRETQMVIFLNNKLEVASFSLPDLQDPDQYYLSYQIRKSQPIVVDTWVDEQGVAHIDIEVPLSAKISVSQNPDANYVGSSRQRRDLREYTEEHLRQRMDDLLWKLQNVYGADALQLGKYVARNFQTIPEWEEYNWEEQFPHAEINVQFALDI